MEEKSPIIIEACNYLSIIIFFYNSLAVEFSQIQSMLMSASVFNVQKQIQFYWHWYLGRQLIG